MGTDTSSSVLVQLRGVSFSYRLANQSNRALVKVDLEIHAGEVVGLLGPSGSGKTTLLNIVGLVEPMQEGQYHWQGRALRDFSEAELNRIRKFEMGFIFQGFNLFPTLTAEENVEFFLVRQGLPAFERTKRVRWALESMDLGNQARKKPLEMSGGQRQRVAIARALAKKPRLVIADEPTASLDQETGARVLEVLQSMNKDLGCSFLITSHDPMVQKHLKRIIRLKDGQPVPEESHATENRRPESLSK